ncbi:MAG: glycine zipper 2TM domain-containing protein [Rhodospirillales bacterium]|nr:glycine zipper 2TM domain-containing protein [Rhodospirillales bacterium]
MFKKALISTIAGLALLGSTASMNTAAADSSNPLGVLLGAAAGGFAGSHIGNGNGRLVATAMGTLLGAAIGSNASSWNGYDGYDTSHTRTVYRPAPTRYSYGYGHAQQRRAPTNIYVDNRTYVTQTSTTVNHTAVTNVPVRHTSYPSPWGYHR